jgi:hypothetical protein
MNPLSNVATEPPPASGGVFSTQMREYRNPPVRADSGQARWQVSQLAAATLALAALRGSG